MGIVVQKLTQEQLSDPNYLRYLEYLDGPWRNDACLGYMIMALKRTDAPRDVIEEVMYEMKRCFDEYTVEEAAQEYFKF